MNSRSCSFFLIFLIMKCLPLSSLTWATPVLEQKPTEPVIVMDEQGNILEISKRKEGKNTVIQAQTYNQSANIWSQPVDLSRIDIDAHHPKIAIDPKGNAIATWQISDGIYECVQTAFYHASTDKWTPAKDLTGFEKDLFVTHLAMGEEGNAFVAWKQGDQTPSKTITFSRALNKWSKLESRELPPENFHDSRFFLNNKNNNSLKIR